MDMSNFVKNIRSGFLISIFFLVLSVPGIGYLFNGTGNFSQNYFPRTSLISGANQFRYHVLKDRMFTGFIANQDGWLMLAKDGLLDYQRNRLFSKMEKRILNQKLKGLCARLTEENIYFVLFITPNKNTIYSEEIPNEILVMDNPSNLEVLKKIWNDTDKCKLLDIRDALTAQKGEGPVYFKTDTHWNQSGAYIGYSELINLLAGWFPQITHRDRSDYRIIKTSYIGDMAQDRFSGLQVSETIPKFTPLTGSGIFGRKWQTIDSLREVVNTYNENESLPSAIIYHDSFMYAMRPFISSSFRQTFQFRDEKAVPSIDIEFIQKAKPDVVIVEITERFIRELLTLPIDV